MVLTAKIVVGVDGSCCHRPQVRGGETWVLALMAALSLLGGAALVGVTRR